MFSFLHAFSLPLFIYPGLAPDSPQSLVLAPQHTHTTLHSMATTLSAMPEEILERILDLVVSSKPCPGANYRPVWHPYPAASASASAPSPHSALPARTPPHLAPLLVSRTWLRIATPLHYRHIVLRSPRNTALLAATLRASPELGRWVRTLRVEGTFQALPDVVRMCPHLEGFDMTVDNGSAGQAPAQADGQDGQTQTDDKVARFCSAFREMRQIRHLVIRKNAYLTQPRPTLIFEELGKAITGWNHLVSLAFGSRAEGVRLRSPLGKRRRRGTLRTEIGSNVPSAIDTY